MKREGVPKTDCLQDRQILIKREHFSDFYKKFTLQKEKNNNINRCAEASFTMIIKF